VVHLRDFTLKPPRFYPRITDIHLGGGTLDFNSIIRACVECNVDYMPIEQNTKTPFESIGKSVDHLKALGFKELF